MNPQQLYSWLLKQAGQSDQRISEVIIGLTWTLCRLENGSIGLAMSPATHTRTLPWSGTLIGKRAQELSAWLQGWNPHELSVAVAALNAQINHHAAPLLEKAQPLCYPTQQNLAVFEHFLPQLRNQRVAVVGRYPGLENYAQRLQLTVLERQPSAGDLPDTACEYVLPSADWVFLTASALTNKTLPRLLELSQNAKTVLMGPTVPWLVGWKDFGVDYLAGVGIGHAERLRQTVAEGGGVRIFEQGIGYYVLEL